MNNPSARKNMNNSQNVTTSHQSAVHRRNSSKVRNNGKSTRSPIIYSSKGESTKYIVTGNSNKQDRERDKVGPVIGKNAVDIIGKFSDERYKEIKDVNLRPSTPQIRKSISNSNIKTNNAKSNNAMGHGRNNKSHQKENYNQNYGKNPYSYEYNTNVRSVNKHNVPQKTKESAAILIQRQFRKFLKNKPKNEIADILKRKKLAILKNYNIIDGGGADTSHYSHISSSANPINNYRSSIKEENKVTGKFGGVDTSNVNNASIASSTANRNSHYLNANSQQVTTEPLNNASKLTSMKEDKTFKANSNYKDNFIDYESFLSSKKSANNDYECKNYPKNTITHINTNNRNSHYTYTDEVQLMSPINNNPNDLDKLKMSLDQYTENYHKSKSVKGNNNKEEDLDILDLITNKDQTSIAKNDISDTVNVYEKIFKEIKKERNKTSKESDSEIKPIENIKVNISKSKSNSKEEMKVEELDSRIEDIDKNINSISRKYEEKQQNVVAVTDVSQIRNRPSDPRDSRNTSITNTNNMINNNNIATAPVTNEKSSIVNFKYVTASVIENTNPQKEYSEEKKKMVDRLTQMLETEELKDNINSKLNISNSVLNSSNLNSNQNNFNDYSSISKQKEVNLNLNVCNVSSNPSKVNTAEVLNMALELKESKKTIETMKDIIDELKREIKIKEEQYKKDIQEKTSVQKYEYENMMQRQNGLIESLLAEKKKLLSNIDELKDKLEGIEKINHKKIQQLVENFDLELKKNKDAWFSAEKLRRKKWEEQKVKEIKEATVKGLEPEIERILASHKQEITRMEDRMTEDLRKQREKLNSEYERRIQDMKDRFNKEKEEALEHERSLAGQRIRNQNERLDEEYNEERRRWNAQFTAEIQRIDSLREKDKKLYDDQLAKIEERNAKLLEEKDNYYKLKISDMEKRFEERVKDENDNYKHRFEKEKEKFIEEKMKEFDQKTREMKNELVKDRDKQIQIIIEKLGEETINERKKIQVECERKADEINKSLKIENEQLHQKLQEVSDKLAAESKVRIMLDDNLDSLSRKIQDKERELAKKEKQLLELNANNNDLSTKYSNIMKDFNKEKLDIELDYKAKLQKTESDFKLLNEKLDSVKSYYESKIVDIQNFHKNEISDLEEKIKKTLLRKDEIIKKVQEELQVKDITIQKYEEMLSKQRKELLMNNNSNR